MTKITDEYRKLNERLHNERPDYGANSPRWADKISRLADSWQCQTAIDYGCGKGNLKNALRRISHLKVENYDPAVPEFASLPAPADLVICTDVMEHIEPACLIDVITHIQELANTGAFFNISTRPAKKTLADGRNAHLIVRDAYFWFDTLRGFFDVTDMQVRPGEANFECLRLGTFYRD